jgi:hypothetical protein
MFFNFFFNKDCLSLEEETRETELSNENTKNDSNSLSKKGSCQQG